MNIPVVAKVVCYVTHADRLLVFTHVDYPVTVTGVQVPAGTVRHGEELMLAAVRELEEETGIVISQSPMLLGTQEYDMRPTKQEVQVRHYFHFIYEGDPTERWFSSEDHDGLAGATRLECFWIPLQDAHVLSAGRGEFLSRLCK